jgi:hypothetical protein
MENQNNVIVENTDNTLYKCDRCGYTTKYKWALIRHLEGKRVCQPLISDISCEDVLKKYQEERARDSAFICSNCNKGFKTRQGLYLHNKKCKDDNEGEINNTPENNQIFQTLLKGFAEQQKEIKSLKEVILSQNITLPKTTNNINTQNNITNNVTQNINIIVPFGEEKTDFIKQLVSFMNDCCSRPESGVTKIIKTIHFHPNRPENYNITFADGKIMTYDGEEWSVPPSKNKVLDDTIEKAVDIMDNHYTTKLESDPDPKHIITKSSMIAFQRKMHRKDLEVIRGLRRNTEQLIKAETEKVHSKYPNLPSTQ